VDGRLIQLEEKITHLEHHLAQLDEVVRESHDRLDRYRRQVEQLQAKVESLESSPAPPPDLDDDGPSDPQLRDDRPPHW
jgi:uncharacterized coiled-coil protein SlyX